MQANSGDVAPRRRAKRKGTCRARKKKANGTQKNTDMARRNAENHVNGPLVWPPRSSHPPIAVTLETEAMARHRARPFRR
jgi:hypothetical protein